jgi:hypothetical protein
VILCRRMRRLLVLFLLMFLSLHNSFALEAVYCKHGEHGENTQPDSHFRHRSYQHAAAEAKQNVGDAGLYSDCGYCHLSCGMAITAASFLHIAPEPSEMVRTTGAARFSSAATGTLYRPPPALHT